MRWSTTAAAQTWPSWVWNWNSSLLCCRVPHFSHPKFFCISYFWIWRPNEITVVEDLQNFPFSQFSVFPETPQFHWCYGILCIHQNSQKTFSKTSSETHLVTEDLLGNLMLWGMSATSALCLLWINKAKALECNFYLLCLLFVYWKHCAFFFPAQCYRKVPIIFSFLSSPCGRHDMFSKVMSPIFQKWLPMLTNAPIAGFFFAKQRDFVYLILSSCRRVSVSCQRPVRKLGSVRRYVHLTQEARFPALV